MMAEWSSDASEYLDGYLKQVSVLVRKQGDDPNDVVAALRDHISNEVESDPAETVTIDLLLLVLKKLGTPEEVANLDLLALASTTNLVPRSWAKRRGLFSGPWACCAAVAIVFVLGLVAMTIIVLMSFVSYRAATHEPEFSDVPTNQQLGPVVR